MFKQAKMYMFMLTFTDLSRNDNREGKHPLYYFAFVDGSFIDFRVIRKEIIRAERMTRAINT